jgi:predicted RNase H-like HicB family nuclease
MSNALMSIKLWFRGLFSKFSVATETIEDAIEEAEDILEETKDLLASISEERDK